MDIKPNSKLPPTLQTPFVLKAPSMLISRNESQKTSPSLMSHASKFTHGFSLAFSAFSPKGIEVAQVVLQELCVRCGRLLLLGSIGDEIAQAWTPIQWHMKNAWSELISCSSYFVFYCFYSLHWFTQRIWDNFYPSSDQHDSLTLILLFFMSLPLYSIDYEQSNAIHSHFTSSQRLLNPLAL